MGGSLSIVSARCQSRYVCPMFFALGAPGALATVFAQAGFVDVEETRLQVELRYADDEAALGAAFIGGPVALATLAGSTRKLVGRRIRTTWPRSLPTQAMVATVYLASSSSFPGGGQTK